MHTINTTYNTETTPIERMKTIARFSDPPVTF